MIACKYCEGEPEPGWIEMDNNGPVVPCPICNPMSDRERAQRDRQAALAEKEPNDD